MESKLGLNMELVNQARQSAAKVADDVQVFIDQHKDEKRHADSRGNQASLHKILLSYTPPNRRFLFAYASSASS